ncbi:hypothetical protein JB92DRAFT_2886592 [Gautieria morchelliformis]|nr:hypothetical protein JB92DRAFT_2886592 [Gautieria morchelliformis]
MDSNSLPPLTLSSLRAVPRSFTNAEPAEPGQESHADPRMRATLAKLGLTCIPPAPQALTLQRGGKIKVNFKMLHLIYEQLAQIQDAYDAGDEYHRTFANDQASQTQSFELLLAQGLDIKALGDLGNRRSKQWSTVNGSGRHAQTRVLMQW